MFKSIGCFYSFDRCVIFYSEIKLDKSGDKVLMISHENFNHVNIDDIVIKLKSFKSSNIKVNKNTGLNVYFHGRLTELDINNQDEIDNIINVYKTLLNKRKLILKTDFEKSNSVYLKGLYLCLYKFKMDKLNDRWETHQKSIPVGIAP